MTTKIALCARSECLEDASTLGLKGERLLDQTWIVPFADALIARKYLQEHTVAETWVISNDSIDGINLAAALKKDNQRNNIRLLLSSPSGSKMSRCENAGVIPICGNKEFARLYTDQKLKSITDRNAASNSERNPESARDLEASLSSPKVTVTRIERTHDDTTDPLPKIEIEEPPLVVPNKQTPSTNAQQTAFETHVAAMPAEPLVAPKCQTTKRVNSPLPALDEGASVISIVSGSGGTGKSSLAAITALLAQKRGIRTLILDADFQFGDLKYLLGYEESLNAADILEHPEQIESLLKVDTWPALLATPEQLEYAEVVEGRIGELLAYLKPHFDLIVVNTGSYWSELHIQLLEASNNVFFLVDQRPSSVRACNHALDLCARCGIATTSFSYLLNFCSKKSLLSSLDVSCALKGAKVYEIKDGGSEVSELLGAGMAHKLSRLNNVFCSSVEAVLDETIYSRIKQSLAINSEQSLEKTAPANSRKKHLGRQKRRAACF